MWIKACKQHLQLTTKYRIFSSHSETVCVIRETPTINHPIAAHHGAAQADADDRDPTIIMCPSGQIEWYDSELSDMVSLLTTYNL